MHSENYVLKSLELHLFFARIMKEHSLFLKAGYTPANSKLAAKAEYYKIQFEKLLLWALRLSGGFIAENILDSEEIVTEFTQEAEIQTEKFTGIHINKNITAMENGLKSGALLDCSFKARRIKILNQTALKLLDGLISLKKETLKTVLDCHMFTVNYPLLIEHIIREAEHYREQILLLETKGELIAEQPKAYENFWNRIMMEHALFIRGLLDPKEVILFDSADKFAKEYGEFLQKSGVNYSNSDILSKTMQLRDFKTAGVKGIENCKIRSVILPLLADHVLREANHYIRLLRQHR